MSARDVDRARWAELAAAALAAAADPAEAAPGIYQRGAVAQTDWVIPLDGRAEGFAFLAFVHACKAFGRADTIRLRARLADLLTAAAETVQALAALTPAPAPAAARLPYAED